MKKTALLPLVFLAAAQLASAKSNGKDIDSVLDEAGAAITSRLGKGAILLIDDFSTPAKSNDMSEYIRERLASKLLETGVKVVERKRKAMDKVDKELNYQMSGLVSDETARSLGQKYGAQAVAFGQMKELDNRYELNLKALDVETGAYVFLKTYEIARSSKVEQLLGRGAIYRRAAFGLRAECNKNSIQNVAFGGGAAFDYNFSRRVAGGAKILVSYDAFNQEFSIATLEPLAALRVYVASPSGEPSTGLYVEGQAGASIIFVNSEVRNAFCAGGAIGFRLGAGNHFYVEPEIRAGTPYMFGAGVSFGARF